MFAAPMPIISWSPSHLLAAPGRERRRGRHRVGQGDHARWRRRRGTARAGRARPTVGMVNGGKPCGSTPIVVDARRPAGRAGSRRARRATTTTSTAGIFGSSRCSSRMPTSEATPMAAAVAFDGAVGHARDEGPGLVDQPVGVDREAEAAWAAGRRRSSARARSCSRSGSAWRAGRRRSRAWPSPATVMTTPTSRASTEARATALAGSPSASTSGRDRRGDHRPERGVGPEHEDPRRPEDRVAEQAEDRGVEAGDRRAGRRARRRPCPAARAGPTAPARRRGPCPASRAGSCGTARSPGRTHAAHPVRGGACGGVAGAVTGRPPPSTGHWPPVHGARSSAYPRSSRRAGRRSSPSPGEGRRVPFPMRRGPVSGPVTSGLTAPARSGRPAARPRPRCAGSPRTRRGAGPRRRPRSSPGR